MNKEYLHKILSFMQALIAKASQIVKLKWALYKVPVKKGILQLVPIIVLLVILLFAYVSFYTLIPSLQDWYAGKPKQVKDISLTDMSEKEITKFHKLQKSEIASLNRKLAKLQPTGNYLIVNTHENIFRLYYGKNLKRESQCSTGSYILLESGDQQKWIFKTPQGMYRIQGKISDPVWRKPDWAFIEEGLPVPGPTHPSRYEYGVLGDYAMSIGNGYLIHGTLYKRYIGLAVTHGCIRLNDSDLEMVFKSLEVGSRVYIY